MQDAAIDIAYSSLLVFVFGTVAWVRRPDDRAQGWFAGWLVLLGAYVAHLGELYGLGWHRAAATVVTVDLTALAGIYFIVSVAIPIRGRRFGKQLGAAIAVPTLACLTLAAINVQGRWLLAGSVLVRQLPLMRMSGALGRSRPRFALVVAIVGAANAVLLVRLIVAGNRAWVIPMILGEVFFVAGMDAWNGQAGNTVGMKVTGLGLAAWAVVFPVAEGVRRIWPQITIDSDLWNPPKACVAMGMLLMVFEEQVVAARALARDYRLLFDDNPNPLWILDPESLRFLAVNGAACALHRYTKEEFLHLRLPDILHPEVRESAIPHTSMPKVVPTRASRHVRKDGSLFPVEISAHSVIFEGKTCRFVMCQDVTQRDHLERKLEYQLGHDAQTGLPNRRLFEQQLSEAVSATIGSDRKLAIVCLDICHFRRLDEVYGARVGDKCVQYVASVLMERARTGDFAARTGDDEFVMVLSGLRDLTVAEELTAFIHERFREPLLIGECEVQLSFNMGVAVCPDDGADAVALWHLAEGAMRRAQANGVGRAVWLSEELRAEAEKTVEIAGGMNKLIEDGHFRQVYQPLYASDGTLCGLEALMRLDHPRFGVVPPLTVVQIAEETGLIEPLAQCLFELSCRQLRKWMDEGMRLVPLAVNISPKQLMREGFAERLAQTMNRFGVNPQWIHLEITESAAMDNLRAVSGEMAFLSALGCRFAIDDFGTGHSSLGRLHRLPIAILKIDRSFVEKLCESVGEDASYGIVQAILSMAHSLGLKVVAEGIETERQLGCLRRLGCDFYQGFLLSKPVRPEEVPRLVTETHAAFRLDPAAMGGHCKNSIRKQTDLPVEGETEDGGNSGGQRLAIGANASR